MPAPIALQLYTVREALARNFRAVVTRIAEIGYVGVEPAGFPGTTPDEASNLLADLGLEICSIHTQLPLGKQKNAVIELAKELEVTRVISGTSRESFASLDGVKEVCDRWNQACETAAEYGLELGLHNHWWEFGQVEGHSGFDLLQERLDPRIFFQVDTYWVNTGGGSAVQVVERLGDRAPLLHIKDGPCTPEGDMTAVGEGRMDFPPIIRAAQDAAEWLIVELDRCATDMMEAVEKSYRYLTGEGLARGAR
ncbi:MAG: sugar phosphate isomerase/epimerase [Candidatus Latescibacterota bacterium]